MRLRPCMIKSAITFSLKKESIRTRKRKTPQQTLLRTPDVGSRYNRYVLVWPHPRYRQHVNSRFHFPRRYWITETVFPQGCVLLSAPCFSSRRIGIACLVLNHLSTRNWLFYSSSFSTRRAVTQPCSCFFLLPLAASYKKIGWRFCHRRLNGPERIDSHEVSRSKDFYRSPPIICCCFSFFVSVSHVFRDLTFLAVIDSFRGTA